MLLNNIRRAGLHPWCGRPTALISSRDFLVPIKAAALVSQSFGSRSRVQLQHAGTYNIKYQNNSDTGNILLSFATISYCWVRSTAVSWTVRSALSTGRCYAKRFSAWHALDMRVYALVIRTWFARLQGPDTTRRYLTTVAPGSALSDIGKALYLWIVQPQQSPQPNLLQW